jgi:NAD(P)-dependent dehydrogenase (short-subunit alcohol dehydrogenase family)
MSIFTTGWLKGKSALVTGGGSGIGAGIARGLSRQGAAVTLVGRTAAKLEAVAEELRQAGGSALAAPADVRDFAAVEGAVSAAARSFGGLDILINSAAGNFIAPAAALSANGFRAVIDIDLCGTFNASRAAFSHLSSRGGVIISITATQATVPTPFQAHAGAAKAGIEKLTRDLALEWAGAGVRVNSVAPGPIEGTEGVARLAPGDAAEAIRRRVPLGRFGAVDEVVDAVLFLCSPAARYITGTSLLVDGGCALLGGGAYFDMFKM